MMRSYPGNHAEHQHQRGPHTSPSGRLGSGVLSLPTPVIPPVIPHDTAPSVPHDMSELDDLAPTEPQLLSIPKLPRIRVKPNHLSVARTFSEFMLGQDWTHDEALAAIPIQRRMRLFSALAPVYLQVVQATGRMSGIDDLDGVR